MLEMSVADCIWFRPKLLKLLVSDEPAREVMGESLPGVLAFAQLHPKKARETAELDSRKVSAAKPSDVGTGAPRGPRDVP